MSQKSCAFHPKHQLVNFCRNMQCLLPMCPICIKIHTAQHQDLKTHGSYDCISDIYAEVQQNLQYSLRRLVDQSSNIQVIRRRQQEEKKELIQKLGQTKSRIMENTLHFVNQIEKDILQQFSSQSKIMRQQLRIMEQKIEKVSQQVQKEIQGLNSQKSLKAIISHLSSNAECFYKFQIEKIKDSIKKFRSKEIRLSKKIDNQGLNEILAKVGNYYYKRYLSKPFSRCSDGDHQQQDEKSKENSEGEYRQMNRGKKSGEVKQSIISKLSKQWQTETSYYKTSIIQA